MTGAVRVSARPTRLPSQSNRASLTITADPQAKLYGATEPALTFSVGGLQLSDTASAVLTGTLTRATGETVASGPYAITQGTLAANSNYSINFAGNALTINPGALAIMAEDKTKVYVTADAKTKTFGTVDPALTVTYSGFVNEETSVVLGGSLQFTRAPGEGVGSYEITPSGLTSGNYLITYNTGTLTITAPAPQMLPVAFTGSNVIISWNAVSNVTYRVQDKTNLLATSWNDLSPDVIANAVTASKTDILTTTRFYRVQVLP